jgi:hypothetical protein
MLNHVGAVRDYAWGRFDSSLGDVNGIVHAKFAPALFGSKTDAHL